MDSRHERELPGEIVRVLNADVHTVGYERTVNVGGIARENHAPGTVSIDHVATNANLSAPNQLTQAQSAAASCCEEAFDCDRRGWFVCRID